MCQQDQGTSFKTLIDVSVAPAASPVELFDDGSTPAYSPNSANVDIMRGWELLRADPPYGAGKEALELWLSDQFEVLQEGYVVPESFRVKTPIHLAQVIEDFVSAYSQRNVTTLRIWNGARRQKEDGNAFLPKIIASRFASQSTPYGNTDEPRCVSVYGMKASKKGILRCEPMLLGSTDSTGKYEIVCQRRCERIGNYQKSLPVRKSQRLSDQGVTMKAKEQCDDWEFVYSQPGAITGFHLDSSRSGRFLHMIQGVKVLCACPCSPRNWEVFKQYYKNMHDLRE